MSESDAVRSAPHRGSLRLPDWADDLSQLGAAAMSDLNDFDWSREPTQENDQPEPVTWRCHDCKWEHASECHWVHECAHNEADRLSKQAPLARNFPEDRPPAGERFDA